MNDHLPKKIEHLATDSLIPYARNSRTHSEEQVIQVAASIREFGFTNPVLIDGAGGIIAGHGRVLAARHLGMEKVPCIRLGHLTELQKRAYVIADNKLALNSEWDENMLAAEIDSLIVAEIDLYTIGFDDDLEATTSGRSAQSETDVIEIQTSAVADCFWISVRGPLVHQAIALQRLQQVMAEMPLSIEIGTVNRDE